SSCGGVAHIGRDAARRHSGCAYASTPARSSQGVSQESRVVGHGSPALGGIPMDRFFAEAARAPASPMSRVRTFRWNRANRWRQLEKGRQMSVLLLGLRLGLAAVFSIAGVAKLRDRNGSRRALVEFGAPSATAPAGAVLLPIAELTTAVALVVTPAAAWGA